MQVGKLSKRCRIERPNLVREDDFGTSSIDWVLHAVEWCNVQDELPSRNEDLRAGATVVTSRTRIRMRYRSDIDTSMRVIMHRPNEVVYSIIGAPAEMGDRDGIEFMLERSSVNEQ